MKLRCEWNERFVVRWRTDVDINSQHYYICRLLAGLLHLRLDCVYKPRRGVPFPLIHKCTYSSLCGDPPNFLKDLTVVQIAYILHIYTYNYRIPCEQLSKRSSYSILNSLPRANQESCPWSRCWLAPVLRDTGVLEQNRAPCQTWHQSSCC